MEPSINFFKNLLNTAIDDLDAQCKIWEKVCEDCEVPEDVNGEIRTTNGLARLLIAQKLEQFRGLIKDSEMKSGEKEITLVDLQGFWDMVYHEVEKIQKSFGNLQDCKNNDWKFLEKNIEIMPKKKVPSNAPAKKTDSSNTHAQAARQRLAEIKKKMASQRKQQQETETPVLKDEIAHILESRNRTSDDESSGDRVEETVPSPSKIPKKNISVSAIIHKSKPSPRKTAKSKATPKNVDKIKEIPVAVQNKENVRAIDVQVTKPQSSKVNKVKKPRNYEEFEKRITRSAKKAMLAKQDAAQ